MAHFPKKTLGPEVERLRERERESFKSKKERVLSQREREREMHYSVSKNQCDKVARLFFQHLVIYINENLPNCIKNMPKSVQIFPKL